MLYHVTHATTYNYTELVALCHNIVHLTPRDSPRQNCLRNQLLITPSPAVTVAGRDYFGNPLTFFTVQEPHRQLTVTTQMLTEVAPFPGVPAPEQSPAWDEVRDRIRTDASFEGLDAYQFVFESVYVKSSGDLADYARASFPAGRPLVEAMLELNRRIHEDFKYDPASTTVTTPLADVLSKRRGVCQDFAHLGIGCLRSLGLPARYVSGYLLTEPPAGQPRLVGADASHAWLSAYCPGLGWIDLDPTNNLIPSEKHVVLSWGRDYDDVSPIKGVILGGGQHTVSVAVDVVRMDATPPEK